MNRGGPTTSPEQRRSGCSATDLAAVRAALRCATSTQWDSVALRQMWRQVHESWLVAKASEIGVVAGSGFAVVATGSLGRGELLPHSDLDLLLVHDGMPADTVRRTAELLWYPLWDANVRLDHSVRTVPQALRVADADILAALAMLDARHIAGDELLSTRLIAGVRQQWRHKIGTRYAELVDVTHARWQRSGEIVGSAEPDLKCGRGGLRDVQLLDALTVAHVSGGWTRHRPDGSGSSLRGAYRTVLDVRTELHRAGGRAHDLLSPQYADEVSAALEFGDRYELAARIFEAARTISRRVDAVLGPVKVSPRGRMSALGA
ncbi:protein-PII uridylyltransferase [Mycolicibacter virginiensis]|uniref:Protein-PII uridylyltransferase n=2 Tax=Mycolicibacter virginiensis TaxID=1795032 RepID=A0A9X7IIT2_9MYCO|nr:protein-PII uridylyltransferase [Mycolicibacter virginiensis]